MTMTIAHEREEMVRRAGESTLSFIRRAGACRDGSVNMDAEFFVRPAWDQEVVCALCPVNALCREFVMREDPTGEWPDVWGGLTPTQRRTLHFKRERVHCPGCGSTAVMQDDLSEICLSCGVSWRC